MRLSRIIFLDILEMLLTSFLSLMFKLMETIFVSITNFIKCALTGFYKSSLTSTLKHFLKAKGSAISSDPQVTDDSGYRVKVHCYTPI